jgi:hypothetical protein
MINQSKKCLLYSVRVQLFSAMVPVAAPLVNTRGGLTVESSPGVMFLDLYALQPTGKAHCDYFYKESNVGVPQTRMHEQGCLPIDPAESGVKGSLCAVRHRSRNRSLDCRPSDTQEEHQVERP